MKPQIIKTESGDELVVLPRREYDVLVKASREDEDAGTARIVARGRAAINAGFDMAIPSSVAEAITRGGNEIRVVREWRGLTQAELANATGLTQSYISQLEGGTSAGTPKALRAIAGALQIPIDMVIPD